MIIPLAAAGPNVATGAFDPEAQAWHSFWWAEGSSMSGYSDTDAVGTWYNETGEANATQGTGANQPTFDAVHASFNDKPVISFDGAGDVVRTGTFTSNPSYASGVSIVSIVRNNNALISGSDDHVHDGIGAVNRNIVAIGVAADRFYAYNGGAGFPTFGSVTNNNAHLVIGRFTSSGSGGISIDGGTEVSSSITGTQTLTGMTIGGPYNNGTWDGQIALLGVWEGDVTAQSWWADFESWVTSHYGITIA